MRAFRDHLESKKRDKTFAREYDKERARLRIAYDIHCARVEKKLSQRQLAEKAGVTQQMVSRIENASSANASLKTVERIAHALECDIGLVPKR